MAIILDGTLGITTPGGDTSAVSYTTPIVKSPTSLTFQTNGTTTAVTIDASQNVGVGVTSPAAKLDVSTSTSYGGIKINGANGASINLYQPQSNASARNYQLLTNWEAWGTLDFQRSADNATAPSVTLMSLNNAGTVVLKGGAISNSGVGIAFPATQVASSDANTLDDYEEGTFTFTATGFTTSQTGTAYYTKIGNQVTLRIPDLAAVSNTTLCTITGLPVELRSQAAYTSYARVYNASTTYNGHLYGGHANTIEVYFDPAESAFTASGVKGITNKVNFSYTLA